MYICDLHECWYVLGLVVMFCGLCTSGRWLVSLGACLLDWNLVFDRDLVCCGFEVGFVVGFWYV